MADSGYDKNEFGDRIEQDEQGRSTGRRFPVPTESAKQRVRLNARRPKRPGAQPLDAGSESGFIKTAPANDGTPVAIPFRFSYTFL